jgi:3-methyladenine DNA glycosylase Tag
MVRAKWPAFEKLFLGFDPGRVHAINDEDLEGQMN